MLPVVAAAVAGDRADAIEPHRGRLVGDRAAAASRRRRAPLRIVVHARAGIRIVDAGPGLVAAVRFTVIDAPV